MSNSVWVSEAIVDFLRGPLYIHPLMEFIDVNCLVFTPEEENKFVYTEVHSQFKDLVDKLLTDFIEELGLTEEEFFEIVSEAKGDKLTKFVVTTLLTVDDFMMFKAMMVKRNCDLTNQVLEAVEKVRVEYDSGSSESTSVPSASSPKVSSSVSSKSSSKSAAASSAPHAHRPEFQMSEELQEEVNARSRLEETLRSFQLEDEDAALAAAMAASLRDVARMDNELAEIEQAIALSIALEEERQRLLRLQEEQRLRALQADSGAPPSANNDIKNSNNNSNNNNITSKSNSAATV
eukprot:CAMPEP_0175059668 /NCGR_PEP_ID=MMETSP0052_2-20121109/12562_1 /TAXON_ID=51329 ORGANISM="Polytomella parva, Strain SAG 63-3" /NCGR_SAMPLE_ID=MMETSP0052_2 /ASSEMBLY_ACC=CAM_ASM_000194 /LENGTH=291 /DNA_ID=CAMNT_0016325247 /DNA_START=32 /DNA_END=903 /DNA_ORIENTATION=-